MTLPAYWWRKDESSRNFGDEITPFIFEKVFNQKLQKTWLVNAKFISTGSILCDNRIWKPGTNLTKKFTADNKLFVFGSGFKNSWINIHKLDWLEILSVRGYLTRDVLLKSFKVHDIPVGDPGLLFPELCKSFKKPIEKKFKFGVIPHHSNFNNKYMWQNIKGESTLFIDFRTDNIEHIYNQMQSCEFIVSQSLHGLIFSDSLGIPNAWMGYGIKEVNQSRFKFYDYFSSIGRPFNKGIFNPESLNHNSIEKSLYVSDEVEINKVKKGIKETGELLIKTLQE